VTRSLPRSAVVLLATRSPRLLYGSLDVLSRAVGARAHRGVTAERVAAVFPALSAAEAERAARQVHASALKTRALAVALGHTRSDPPYPIVRVDSSASALPSPAVLISFHVGPFAALAHVLQRLPGEVLAPHYTNWTFPPNVRAIGGDRDEAERAAAFYRAVTMLRAGAHVFLMVETIRGLGVEVPLLGGSIPLARGAFALSRLTRVPVVPLFARWTGPDVTVAAGETIAPCGDETAQATAAARALERHLLAHPGEIGAGLPTEIIRSRSRATGRRAAS
jgi:lauroyl/myristoyl acyltransferase